MLNQPVLDVAIGLTFLYFVLALVCSGINETISSWMRLRAQVLERGLWELLQDPEEGGAALEKLKEHPLISPMLRPTGPKEKSAENDESASTASGPPKTSRQTEFPSYLPSRTFVTALLGFEQNAVAVVEGQEMRDALRTVDKSINQIPSPRVQQALTALLHGAQGDAVAFRHSVEQWYDDHMERVSGWYRRRIQKILWVLAFVVAISLNADSLQTAKQLWVEPSVRSAIVTQAQHAGAGTAGSTNPASELASLSVPLGWHLASARHDPQGFPFYEKWSMLWTLLSKLVGLTLTAVALSFGAPFWFDTLSKLGRLRNSGAPPPASDAVRRGEGEELRRGDGSTQLATALVALAKREASPVEVTPDTPASA